MSSSARGSKLFFNQPNFDAGSNPSPPAPDSYCDYVRKLAGDFKKLEDIERERTWPTRSAKVVLQLALDRLARHYGYAAQTKGQASAEIRTWLADGAAFSVDGG